MCPKALLLDFSASVFNCVDWASMILWPQWPWAVLWSCEALIIHKASPGLCCMGHVPSWTVYTLKFMRGGSSVQREIYSGSLHIDDGQLWSDLAGKMQYIHCIHDVNKHDERAVNHPAVNHQSKITVNTQTSHNGSRMITQFLYQNIPNFQGDIRISSGTQACS